MQRFGGVVVAVVGVAFLFASGASAAEGQRDAGGKSKPVVVGNLILNAKEVIAVYRPADGSSVGVLIGKPGQAIQQIVLKDFREATAVFNDLWNNHDVVKDPGEDDARPLTRMMLKPKEGEDVAKRVPTLILNADRILAIAWDTEQRVAHLYVDRPAVAGEQETLIMTREEAELVIAAFKTCLLK